MPRASGADIQIGRGMKKNLTPAQAALMGLIGKRGVITYDSDPVNTIVVRNLIAKGLLVSGGDAMFGASAQTWRAAE